MRASPGGGLLGDVLDHDVQAGAGAGVRDAGAHHPRAEHRHPAGGRDLHGGPARAAVDRAQVEEERADHVLGDLAGQQPDQVAGLHEQRGFQVDLGALDRGGQDRLGRRQPVALELLAQRRRVRRELGFQRSRATGSLAVPRLGGVRVRGDPLPRPGQHLRARSRPPRRPARRPARRPGRNCRPVSRTVVRASGRPSIRTVRVTPPAPGSSPRVTSGKADPAARRVERDPVVAGQGDLQAAAERRAVDRRDDRPAEGLQPAQVALDRGEQRGQRGCVGRRRLDHLGQVAAGEERRLGAGDDDPGDHVAVGLEPVDGGGHGCRVRPVHGVRRLPRVVEGERDDAVVGPRS